MIPISKHIDTYSAFIPKFDVFLFYKMKAEETYRRKQKEQYFIKLFNTELNYLRLDQLNYCTNKRTRSTKNTKG